MTRVRRGSTLIACAVGLCLGTAHAAQLNYEATAGMGHSDNLTRTEQNTIDEEIATAGLLFSLDQASTRLTADMVGNLAYYDYLDDTYDSELLGNFAGTARWQFVPERFSWMVADNFGQVLRDAFEPATPENRENINYLTTGPDLMFAFGAQTRLRLGGRYSMTTYEDTPFDSDARLVEAELGRSLSGASTVSLNARSQTVEYDDLLGSDFDQREAFVRYITSGARTHLTVDAGYNDLDREAVRGTDSGLLFRLDVSRRVSAASTVTLRAAHEFTSAGASFASSQSGGVIGPGTAPGRQAADPFMQDELTLGWNYARERTSLSLYASHNKQTHDGQPLLDQTLDSVTASVEREMSVATRLGLDSTFSRGEFEQPGGDYDELTAGVRFAWQLSRNLSLNFTYDYFDRTSDAVDGGYTENRFWVSLGFNRGVPRAQLLQPTFAVDAVQQPGT